MDEPLVGLDLLQGVGEAGYGEDLATVRLLQRIVHRPRHDADAAPSPGRHVLLGGGRLVYQHRRNAHEEPEEMFQQERVQQVGNYGEALHHTGKSGRDILVWRGSIPHY